MIGMMNCNNDAVEFYSAPASKSGSAEADEETKVFVEHKERKKISYTKDGRKMIDGKVVETSDDESSSPHTPQKMWDQLILTSVATGMTLETSDTTDNKAGQLKVSKPKDKK